MRNRIKNGKLSDICCVCINSFIKDTFTMPPAKEVKKKSAHDRAALVDQINVPELTETLFELARVGTTSSLIEILTPPSKNVENPRFEAIQQHHLLQARNDQTRTCLDLVTMLGHDECVKILAEKAATTMTDGINIANGMGYSSLHLACAWNRLEAVKHIIAAGGDIEQKTVHGETAVDVARRYKHENVVNYLEWIAVRNTFINILTGAKEFIADPTKNLNKLNKDDKKKMEKYLIDAQKWSDENQNATNARDLFVTKIQEAKEFFAPFYANVISETDLSGSTTSSTSRLQPGPPKSGKK